MTSSKKYLGLLMAGTLVAANAMAQNKPVETKNGSATVTISPVTSAPQPASAQPGAPAQQAAAPAKPKEIKDQAEYSAYSSALNQTNPQAQAAQLESFLQMYPNTVVKEDALTVLLKAYQSTNDAAHMNDAAQQH